MELAYVAHSQRCALLLDGEGVCRWVVPKVDADDPAVDVARRCMGAQFVASLDPEVEGLLGHQPRVGVTLLFAAVKDGGRVSLVRFGPLLGFDTLDAAMSTERSEWSGAPSRSEASGKIELVAQNIELATAPERDEAPQPITEEPITAAAPSTPSLPSLPSQPATLRVEAVLSEQSPPSVNSDGGYASRRDADVQNPFGKISSPAVASFLKDIAELADAPYSRRDVKPVDDVARSEVVADGDQLTTAFARASSLDDLFTDLSDFETRVPAAEDSEVEITGSFASASELAGEPIEASLDDDDRAPTVQRPSGFMVRAARPMDDFTERNERSGAPSRSEGSGKSSVSDLLDDPIFEPVLDMDQATSRFARLSGSESAHLAYKELAHTAPAPSNEPRRGILPRRSSR